MRPKLPPLVTTAVLYALHEEHIAAYYLPAGVAPLRDSGMSATV